MVHAHVFLGNAIAALGFHIFTHNLTGDVKGLLSHHPFGFSAEASTMGNINTPFFSLLVVPANSSNTSLPELGLWLMPLPPLPPPLPPSFLWPLPIPVDVLDTMMKHCHVHEGRAAWTAVKILVMFTALPANAGLMWALLKRKTAMTPSEVLGLNVSVVDLLYCLCLPLDIYVSAHAVPETALSLREALFALNMFGCPLLLTFMCVERCLAVVRPVTYIRLGRWWYRLLLCALSWLLTLTVGLLLYFLGLVAMSLYLSLTISMLFLLMLLCLLGIVWVLLQSGPGEGPGAGGASMKRTALQNVVAVMVPSAVAYCPLVAVVPYMAVITLRDKDISPPQCDVLEMLLLFPNLGLFIGPMFYLSRLRRLSCCSKTPETKTQTQNNVM